MTNDKKIKSTASRQTIAKAKMLAPIMKDPVLWAKVHLITVNNKTKKTEPWTARWYQAEMLRDKSLKKVARCGRRTGKKFAHVL